MSNLDIRVSKLDIRVSRLDIRVSVPTILVLMKSDILSFSEQIAFWLSMRKTLYYLGSLVDSQLKVS